MISWKISLVPVLALVLLVGGLLPSRALAQNANELAFQADITTDTRTILSTLNDPFAKGMGFFTSLGWNTPPEIYDLKDGPRVNIGVGLGAQIVNLPDLSGLTSMITSLAPGSTVDIPTFLPLPFPVATARVGLFNGLDVGGKLIYIPSFDLSAIGIGIAAEITGFGFDIRFKVVDDPLLPTLVVAASYDRMTGNVTVSTDVNQTFAYGGGNGTISGTPSYSLDWDTQSFGARVIAGKDLGGFYPFGSIGFQRHFGSVTSTYSGLVTSLDAGAGGTGANFNLANVGVNQSPVVFEPSFVVGLDVGEGFKWGLFGESNGVDLAAGTNFKGNF